MSPRIKINRKILSPPSIKGLKPYGNNSLKNNKKIVFLFLEEYESIRLCDYEMYNHHQASIIMSVSRPTFTRIYSSARQKVAKALSEGLQLSIEGGKVYFDSDWYECNDCECFFNSIETEKPENCPLCNTHDIKSYSVDNDSNFYSEKESCICPNCGNIQQHTEGIPCKKHICQKCKSFMRRK